ncbi:MAG: hypothetical protein L0099_05725, partial [Acidobacteria bacterium]|nr:hypothetical protein [Acidobacteriota bacterium]
VAWDAARRVAFSDAYNTQHFLTPLVELPMDRITPQEQNEYQQFRQQYIQLWRRFFDPVGIRVALRDKRVQMEVYILPLINNAEYNNLRMTTGGGTSKFDVSALSPRTLLQFMGHLSLRGLLAQGTDAWFMIRLDDSGSFAKLAQLWVQRDLHGTKDLPIEEGLVLVAQLPVTAAVGGDEKLVGQIADMFSNLNGWMGPATNGKSEYRKTTVNWIRFAANSQFVQMIRGFSNSRRPGLELTPTLYFARIDDAFYAGFSEEALRELIEASVARKEGRGPAKSELIDVNTALYLSPQAAFKAKEAFEAYLEWETHKRAWPNNAILYALHRCQVVDEAGGG